ncbi:phenylalanine and histidine ammonia-lyase [Xylariaceae sp. FL0804]|nr:phenylalanine and histidine ammonia-lyase [Xylariaceae sp. FL0804]
MDHTQTVLDVWRRLDALLSGGDKAGPVSLTGRSLTIPDVVWIARYHGDANVSSSTHEAMHASQSLLVNKLQAGEVIYGVNTGFGGTADTRTNKLVELQRALIREFHYGVLPSAKRDARTALQASPVHKHRHDMVFEYDSDANTHLPWSWTRAAILIRVNSLIAGASAVRPVIVERMMDLLKHDIIPMIPLRGSISASGDLSPLSYICGAIQAKPTIRVLSRGLENIYADMAFANAGLDPLQLQAKEGLAMVNGTGVSCAAGTLALHDTHGLAVFAQILTAMSVEALNGTDESFHPFFSEKRPHPGQIESARNILAFLAGSKLTRVNDGAGSSLRQDRYAVRTAPQWMGPILEDLVLAHQQMTIECNSTTDNPLVNKEGDFLHGGNFQAKAVTSAMEKARQAIQGMGRMSFAQCTEIINPATNRGLPPNLLVDDPSISLIFKGTDINIASLCAELGFLANPVNHVQTAEMGNQALNSLALISARYTHTAVEVLSQLFACHLLSVCQALDLRAMQDQFLSQYQAVFRELVAEHHATADQGGCLPTPPNYQPSPPSGAVNVLPAAAQLNESGLMGADPNDLSARILLEKPASGQALAEEETPVNKLTQALWTQLQVSFDSTASMDAEHRFEAVAKSLRAVVLDAPGFGQAPDLAAQLERFTGAVAASLRESWCANRDAYVAHGDASPLLGRAAREVYTFVRRTLKIPLLATAQLMTPTADQVRAGGDGLEAPTVGSHTGTLYRALRDGTLVKVAMDLLEDCA